MNTQTDAEFHIEFNEKSIVSISQYDLFDQLKGKYYLYGILLAPRFYYFPDKIIISKQGFFVNVWANVFGERKDYIVPCVLYDDLDHRNTVITPNYPYSVLNVTITDEEWLKSHNVDKKVDIPVSLLFDAFASMVVRNLRYKVLYIGQSFGNKGSRDAMDRLSDHPTFQRILMKAQTKYPEYELKLLFLDPKPHSLIELEDNFLEALLHDKADIGNLMKRVPDDEQIINITEAALINFFKPEYNKNFVANFPRDTHSSYHQFYDMNYRKLIVEMGQEYGDILVDLFSDNASTKSVNGKIEFDLQNQN